MLVFILSQGFPQCAALRNSVVIGCLINNETVTYEIDAGVVATGLPVSHPLAIAPAI